MIKKFVPFLLVILILISSIIFAMGKNNTGTCNSLPANDIYATQSNRQIYNISDGEMKAVWVTFMSLDMKGTPCTEETFKAKFDKIIEDCKGYGLNTLIVHVRSHSDAMYKSNIFPYSHILTGTQGDDPGFDPLLYMTKKAHEENMSFHAWINPLRIRLNNTPKVLCDQNPYNLFKNKSEELNKDFIINHNGNLYYNPAYPEVREMIINGVKEIIENYSVDAIHFDDYFYPDDNPELDKISYNEYCAGLSESAKPLELNQWRIANINSLISGVYSAIKSVNKNIQFGISPSLNVQNDLKLGADVYSWGSKNGYVDYLCPQIYVNFDHPVLTFNESADQWKDIVKNKNIKYYIGLGLYKAGSSKDQGTWLTSNDILKKEIEYARNINCDGFMIYSYDYLNNELTSKEVANMLPLLKN